MTLAIEILYFWIGLILIQSLLWFRFYLSLRNNTISTPPSLPVSIIICAKNAAVQLDQYLPIILEQDYSNYECIVVDDQSTDYTTEVLDELMKRYSHLKVIKSNKPNNLKGKRYALKKGIEAAKYSQLLLTDADCEPSSDQWLQLMLSEKKDKVNVVLGLAPYFPKSDGVNIFARYENLYTGINYIASARIGFPYMGVGRNILYSKELIDWSILEEDQLSSGDDDLMVNKIANASNTSTMMDERAFCYSEAPRTWKEFFNQKRRHVSTGTHYQWKHWLWLNLINGTQSLIHLFSLFLIFYFPIFTLCFLILRWSIMILAFSKLMKITRSQPLLFIIPILDYCLSLYFLIVVPFVFIRKKDWN